MTRVAQSVFARQMTALARDGWRSLTLAEYAGGGGGAGKAFLLTFDDGYASLAEQAYPLLAALGFTATTFLITDYVGKTNTWDVRYTWRRLGHLDWPAIEQWQARGFSFGSHGATHRRLTWLEPDAVAEEVGRSRQVLVDRLGPEAGRAFAYPFGATNDAIGTATESAGYEWGFSGPSGDPADPLLQPRTPVYVWDVGNLPLGLRTDTLGDAGRFVARVANACAVGTSWMLKLRETVRRAS